MIFFHKVHLINTSIWKCYNWKYVMNFSFYNTRKILCKTGLTASKCQIVLWFKNIRTIYRDVFWVYTGISVYVQTIQYNVHKVLWFIQFKNDKLPDLMWKLNLIWLFRCIQLQISNRTIDLRKICFFYKVCRTDRGYHY